MRKSGIADDTKKQHYPNVDGIVGNQNSGQQLFGPFQQLNDNGSAGSLSLVYVFYVGLRKSEKSDFCTGNQGGTGQQHDKKYDFKRKGTDGCYEVGKRNKGVRVQ